LIDAVEAGLADWADEHSGAGPADERGRYRPGGAAPDAGAVEVHTDTTVPTWSSGAALTTSGLTQVKVRLHWPEASDDIGLHGFVITGGPSTVHVGPSARSATLTGLTPGRQYDVVVRAEDAAGNQSAPLTATVTTPSSPSRPFAISRVTTSAGLVATDADQRYLVADGLLIERATGDERTLDGGPQAISDDGSTVVWVSDSGSDADGTFYVVSVLRGFATDLDGGTVSTVKVHASDWLNRIAVSADGSRLALVSADGGTAEATESVAVVSLGATPEMHTFSFGSAKGRTELLRFSPDGLRLLRVASYRYWGVSAVQLWDVSDPASPAETDLLQPYDPGMGVQAGQTWGPVAVSRDFSTLAYVETNGEDPSGSGSLVASDLDGGHRRVVATDLGTELSEGWLANAITSLSLDGDGSTVAYTLSHQFSDHRGTSGFVSETTEDADPQLLVGDDLDQPYEVYEPPILGAGGGSIVFAAPSGVVLSTGDDGNGAGTFVGVADDVAPTWPSGAALTATDVTTTGLTLHWPAATDDQGLAGYAVTGGPAALGAPASATSLAVSGLEPGTSYTFGLRARDGSGNVTDPLTLTVSTAADITPGTASLTATPQADGTVALAWDAVAGVSGYQVQRALGDGPFAQIGTTAAATRAFTDRTPDGATTYRYRVLRVVDGSSLPHTVIATAVTGPVAIASVEATMPLVAGQAAYDALVTLTVRGQPRRAGSATLHATSAEGDPLVASGTLSEDATTPGRYTATVRIPAGATVLTSLTATLHDSVGTGSGHVADIEQARPISVAAQVVVTIPSSAGFSGSLAVGSSAAGFARQQAIASSAGATTMTFDLPSGDGYVLRAVRGGVTPMVERALGTLRPGTSRSVALRSLDVASLTLHLGSAGARRAVSVTGEGTGLAGLATGTADSAGDVTVAGLLRGSPVRVSVGSLADDWGLALPEGHEIQLPEAATSADLPVAGPAAASVHGQITATDHSALSGLALSAIQTWHGQSRTAWATIADDGSYTVSGLLAGLPTTLSAGGVLYGATTADLTPVAGGNTQDLTVTPTGSYEVRYSIATQLGSDAPQPQALDWRTLVHFHVRMAPAPGVVSESDFLYANGSITVRGNPGSAITFCADGYEGGYGADCVTKEIPDPTVTRQIDLPLTLVSQARVEVSVTSPTADDSATVVGTLRGSGQTVSGITGTPGSLALPLPASGTWDFVAYGGSGAVGRASVDTASGSSVAIAMASPPAGFPATDNELATSQADVQPGGVLDLTARWRSTGETGGSATLRVRLPQGTTVAGHGVTVDGVEPATAPTVSDGVLTVPVGALTQGAAGRATIRLRVASDPDDLPPTRTLGVSADLVAGSVTVPLGALAVEVAAVTITAPEVTGATSVRVRGRAAPGETVTVLDGAEVVGTAVAGAGGAWTTRITLPDHGQGATHSLAATTGSGATTQASAVALLTYDRYHPTLLSATVSQDGRSGSGEQGASFPLVVVPGARVDVAAHFADPSLISNATLSIGSSTVATGRAADGAITASFGGITPRGPVTIDYDATAPTTVPLVDLAPSTPPAGGSTPTANDVRASLGATGALFGTPALGSVDNGDTGSATVTIPVPGLGSGATATMKVTKTPVSGVPSGSTQIAPGVWTSGTPGLSTASSGFAVTGTTYVDTSVASQASGFRALSAPRGRRAASAASATVRVGYEIAFNGVTSLDDALDAFGAGDKYQRLAALLDTADDCGGSASGFRNRIDDIATRAAADDATKATMMLAGVLLGPETFGIGTLAMWAASTAMEKLLDDSLQDMIDDVVADMNASGDCPKEKTTHKNGPVVDPQWIYDPSGTVYDGPTTSPLSGATVTLLRSDTEDGTYDLWDADAYAQGPNPATTAGDGAYGWNVPEGWYEVVATKAGRLGDASEPLEVLPPRTGIDLVLPTEEAVTADTAAGQSDGSILVTFSSWVDAALVNDRQIAVTDASGVPLSAEVTPVSPQPGVGGGQLATQARVSIAGLDRSAATAVTVQVDQAIQDVAGRPLAASATLAASVPAVVVPPVVVPPVVVPPVKVAPGLKLAKPATRAAKKIRVRRPVVLTGRAVAAARGSRVVLQQLVRRRWVAVASATVSSSGTLRFTVRPRKRGTWTLRLSIGATARTTAGVSPVLRLKVR
ncbi:MAG: fibronectin type III domain-containing protein, partial [Nocardioides sp.]|uniref:fibronectin type III domain-containing protein n=1 Tax=Nocardioides sp. TaxID=35761 RepID=UPI0039E5F41B